MKNVTIIEEANSSNSIMDMTIMHPMMNKGNIMAASSFQEAYETYETGPEEVKILLKHECNLIYECCVCRNMFRNLQNFISHKRLFCCAKSTVDTKDDQSINGMDNNVSNQKQYSSKVPRQKDLEADTSHSKLRQGDGNENMANDLKPTITPVPLAKLLIADTTTEQQTTMESRNNGSSSIVAPEPEKEQEVCASVVNGGTSALSAEFNESKDLTVSKNTAENKRKNRNVGEVRFKCNICGIELQTSKALQVHIQKRHSYVNNVANVQCPSCSKSFTQTSAVFQHLSTEHNFSMRRIRMLRDTIAKRHLQELDNQKNENTANKEMKKQETSGMQMNAAECGGDTSSNHSEQNVVNCPFCHLKFDRKSALTAHLISCTTKLEIAEEEKAIPALADDIHDARIKIEKINQTAESLQMFSTSELDDSTTSSYKQNPTLLGIEENAKSLVFAEGNSGSNSSIVNKLFDNLEKNDFGFGLKTVTFDQLNGVSTTEDADSTRLDQKFENSQMKSEQPTAAVPVTATAHDTSDNVEVGEKSILNSNQKKVSSEMKVKKIQKIRKMLPIQQLCRCKICGKQFNALSNLRRHISMFHYRSRKYGCTLCDYCAFRRYDIINHLMFVHKMTGERDSMSTEYVKVNEVNYTKDDMDGDIMLCSENMSHDSEAIEIKPEQGLSNTTNSNIDSTASTSNANANANANSNSSDLCPDSSADTKTKKKILRTYEKCSKRSHTEKTLNRSKSDGDQVKEEPEIDDKSKIEKNVAEIQINTRQKLKRSTSSNSSDQRITATVNPIAADTTTTVTTTTTTTTPVATCSNTSKSGATLNKIVLHTRKNFTTKLNNGSGRPKTPQRRPIRNRIKPVNKDFVYELGGGGGGGGATASTTAPPSAENNSKHYSNRESNSRPVRRRNIVNKDSFVDRALATTVNFSPLNQRECRKLIKGSARRIALFLINQGQAVLPTLPEMPTERPQIRPRPLAHSHMDANIIETTELEAARMKSTLLDDTFLREKINKQSSVEFKIKPCLSLSQHSSALDTLLQKVDFSMHNKNQSASHHQHQHPLPHPHPHSHHHNELNATTNHHNYNYNRNNYVEKAANESIAVDEQKLTLKSVDCSSVDDSVGGGSIDGNFGEIFGMENTSLISSSDSNQTDEKLLNYWLTTPEQAFVRKDNMPPCKPRKRECLTERLDDTKRMYIDSKYLRRALEN